MSSTLFALLSHDAHRTRSVVRAFLILGAALLLSPLTAAEPDIAEQCRKLGRGINLGNALDGPSEGAWGMTVKEEYLKAIHDAGFDSVRLPVRWSAHAEAIAPYTIDAVFFARVDEILDQCARHQLNCVLNVHHYGELNTHPEEHGERLAALWTQIASRYAGRPDSLYFELNNEPHEKLDDTKWNALIPKGLAAIRATNPQRPVIIGPHSYNAIWALPRLQLPNDPNLIVTVHNYDPFEFTHQGADWAPDNVKRIRNRAWTGSPDELAELRKSLDAVAQWSAEHKRPIYLGEFGAYESAPLDSRVRWTAAMVHEAEARGFSWAYWEFGSGFGAYDREQNAWREPLLKALLPTR